MAAHNIVIALSIQQHTYKENIHLPTSTFSNLQHEMTSNLPRTPETPSQTSPSAADFPIKPVTSPIDHHSMPTPARSVNGSMSSINPDSSFEATAHDDTSLKRKRESDDQGDQEQKKVHVEEPESLHSLTLNDLHLDVGEKYYLCKTRKTSRFSQIYHFPGFVFQTLPCTSF